MKPTRETEDMIEWSRSCQDWQQATDTPRRLFVSINDDSTIGKRPGCSWEANPFVWVVGFKRVEPQP